VFDNIRLIEATLSLLVSVMPWAVDAAPRLLFACPTYKAKFVMARLNQ
jgi:hypothetical protein